MDNEREKWIARADAYKRKHGSEMVTIFRHGIYENWPAVQFDKLGDPEDVVYRTDGVIPQILRMTVGEYAAQVYERRELP